MRVFTIVLLRRHLRGCLITELQQVIGFLFTLLYADVVRHTGGIERTVRNDWLDLTQDFTLGIKTLSDEVGNNLDSLWNYCQHYLYHQGWKLILCYNF